MTSPRFPTGLYQPPGAARFSLDSLLLAGFVASIIQEKPHKYANALVELGCGVGAAALALGTAGVAVAGIEKAPELLEAAQNNARSMNLERVARFVKADLESDSDLEQLGGLLRSISLIYANPPWYQRGTVRLSPHNLRKEAWTTNNLSFFCPQAARLLPHKAIYCVIIPGNALCAFMQQCELAHLGVRRILPVASHQGEAASRLLIMTQKGSHDDPVLLPPLYVHENDGNYTIELLKLCPWIRPESADS